MSSIHLQSLSSFSLMFCRYSLQRVARKTIVQNLQHFSFSSSSSSSSSSSNCTNNLVLYNSLNQLHQPLFSCSDDNHSNTTHPNIPNNIDNITKVIHQKPGFMWYTCGPTVYDSAHLGHARTYVCIDILHRLILHLEKNNSHKRPLFIMNITDVDDKILLRAKELNVSPIQLAKKYEEEFWSDMDALHVMRPTVITRVTEHVESTIIPFIQTLLDKGMAYISRCGSVYFDVQKFDALGNRRNRYGKLSNPTKENEEGSTFFSWNDDSERNETTMSKVGGTQKRDPRDFALWKSRFDGQEAMIWNSPWGLGRPGWHIECSAMIHHCIKRFPSYKLVVHAGGIDLKSLHHTNEIAQSEAHDYVDGQSESVEWIPHWIHTGHLHIDGLKMSKSLKNFVTIRSLLQSDASAQESLFHSPSDDFRLWCLGLSGSYRGPATYSETRLKEAKIIREKIVRFLLDSEDYLKKRRESHRTPTTYWNVNDLELFERVNDCRSQCSSSLTDDFDGTAFLHALMTLVEAGSLYIRNNDETNASSEQPLRMAVQTIRDHLQLVGFTNKTVMAGVSHLDGSSRTNVIGGETALIEEIASLRSQIRTYAIQHLRSGGDQEGTNLDIKGLSITILKACDDSRTRLSCIGVELLDGSIGKWKFKSPGQK